MGGPRTLLRGAPRLLGNHGGHEGAVYRQMFAALEAELGPFTDLERLEAGRVAVAWLQLQTATASLVAAQRKRRNARFADKLGRKKTDRQMERLARRQGLADQTFSQAIDKLRELTKRRAKTPTVADLVAKSASTPSAPSIDSSASRQ